MYVLVERRGEGEKGGRVWRMDGVKERRCYYHVEQIHLCFFTGDSGQRRALLVDLPPQEQGAGHGVRRWRGITKIKYSMEISPPKEISNVNSARLSRWLPATDRTLSLRLTLCVLVAPGSPRGRCQPPHCSFGRARLCKVAGSWSLHTHKALSKYINQYLLLYE